jgi:transcriptional regulator with XRE-family HTH domain
MIKELRLSHGWSQEQLAQFSGLSVRTIQRLERGQNAGLESLKSIAATFDIDVAELNEQSQQKDELFQGANVIMPVISVRDTARFYVEKLGFDIEILWENPPYGVVARGQTIIEFGEGRQQYAGSGVCIVFVKDTDAVYREYIDKDIELVGDIADRDYGTRDFRIRDNNGNMLIICSSLANQQELLSVGNTVIKNSQS